jgi:hypothetical protein
VNMFHQAPSPKTLSVIEQAFSGCDQPSEFFIIIIIIIIYHARSNPIILIIVQTFILFRVEVRNEPVFPHVHFIGSNVDLETFLEFKVISHTFMISTRKGNFSVRYRCDHEEQLVNK